VEGETNGSIAVKLFGNNVRSKKKGTGKSSPVTGPVWPRGFQEV